MPSTEWRNKFTTKRLNTLDEVRALIARIGIRGSLLADYHLGVLSYPRIVLSYHVDDVDKPGNPTEVGCGFNFELPVSERSLATRIVALVFETFVHEFEECLLVDKQPILEPHNEMIRDSWPVWPRTTVSL